MSFGTLRVFNDDRLVPGAIWPMHPHRDIEGLTYVVEGSFRHQDDVGGAPGPLPAGLGAAHDARLRRVAQRAERERDRGMRFIQMWIMPNEQGLTPGVEQKVFTIEDRTDTLLKAISGDGGEAVLVHQDAHVFVSRADHREGRHTRPAARAGRLPVRDRGRHHASTASVWRRARPRRSATSRRSPSRPPHDCELILVDVALGLVLDARSGRAARPDRRTATRPCSSNRSIRKSDTSTTSVRPSSARSAAHRATAGPHIMPWPHADATDRPSTSTPAFVTTGPSKGRWSGVYSIVAAHALRMPSPAVTGTSFARRRCIFRRWPSRARGPRRASRSGCSCPRAGRPPRGASTGRPSCRRPSAGVRPRGRGAARSPPPDGARRRPTGARRRARPTSRREGPPVSSTRSVAIVPAVVSTPVTRRRPRARPRSAVRGTPCARAATRRPPCMASEYARTLRGGSTYPSEATYVPPR